MSLDTIRQAIEQRFYDNWTGTDKDTHVRYSNTIFRPPENASWASIDVRWLPTINAAISTTLRKRRRGLIVMDTYVAIDAGSGALMALADEAITVFENQQFAVTEDAGTGAVQCSTPDVRHIGVTNTQGTDAAWYKYSIRVPFYRDED